ncbi:MAG TPA: sialate O-acetylesterase, partial [Lacunisphaera sp.]
SFEIPADWAGRDLELHLGAIDDIDTTWVNGVEIGTTSGWNQPRIYRVPAAALKPAGNVIAVRVLDTGFGGGLWDPKFPLSLAPADGPGAPLSLNGPWLARFSTELSHTSQPPADHSQSSSAPTVLFNGMIAPLVPYAIRGVTFYQGEANAPRATQYRTLFPALITDWRRLWGQGDFPFLFVQIAPFKDQPPEIREAQLIAWQNTRNTAMAVTVDVGDAEDIHPANKGPVGARLALTARALAYGEKLEYSGPVYAGAKFSGGRAVLAFTHLGGGLVVPGGTLTGFTIASADGVFHPATAKIVGDTVVVTSPDVAAPTAVRYAWANVASGNLFNRAGLPASPFRTDIDTH